MFNSKPATGGLFGSTSNNANAVTTFAGFGQQQQSTNLFGQPAANPGTSAAFGMQIQRPAAAAAPFGGTGGFGFGSNVSASANNAFFGTQPAASSNLFGQQQRSATPFAPFGSGGLTTNTAAGGLFGQPAPNAGAFGGQTGLSNTAGSLFGGMNSAQNSAFGANAAFPAATSLQQAGTAVARFQPLPGTEPIIKNGFQATSSTNLQVISAMDAYKDKSLEELRAEDYSVNRKGAQNSNVFGGSNNSTMFGGNTSMQPLNLATGGLFPTTGRSAQPPQQPTTSNVGAFATNNSVFAAASHAKPLFGSGSAAMQPAFPGCGQPAATTASTWNSNAGTSAGGFGTAATQPAGFGQKPFVAWGGSTAQQSSAGGFGTNVSTTTQSNTVFPGFNTNSAASTGTAPTLSYRSCTRMGTPAPELHQHMSILQQPLAAVTSTSTNLFTAPVVTSAGWGFDLALGQQLQQNPGSQFPSSAASISTAPMTQPTFSYHAGAEQQQPALPQQPVFGGFGAPAISNSGSLLGSTATSTQQPNLFGGFSTQPAQYQSPGLFPGFNTAARTGFSGLRQPSMQQQQITFPFQQPSSSTTSSVFALMKRYPHISNPLGGNMLPLESGIDNNNNYGAKPIQLAKDMVRVMHETYKFDTSGAWPGSPQWGSSQSTNIATAKGDNNNNNNDDISDWTSSTRYYPPPPVRLESIKRRVFTVNPTVPPVKSDQQQNGHSRRSVTLSSPNGSMARRRNGQNLITVDPVTMQQAGDLNASVQEQLPPLSSTSVVRDQGERSSQRTIERTLNEQVRARVACITAEICERKSAVRNGGALQENDDERGVSPSSLTSTPATQIYSTLASAFNNGEVSAVRRDSPLTTTGNRLVNKRLSYMPPVIANENNDVTPDLDNGAADENKIAVAPILSSTVVISARPDYQIFPKTNFKLDANGRCFVVNFRIHRPGFGSIEWPGRTDVAGLNIDELIHIDRKSVTVYGGETSETKPAVGDGLNKLAMVQFENVRTSEKRQAAMNGIQSRSSPNARKYVNFLRKSVEAMNGTFLEYDWEDDTLTFEVQHF